MPVIKALSLLGVWGKTRNHSCIFSLLVRPRGHFSAQVDGSSFGAGFPDPQRLFGSVELGLARYSNE